LQDINFLIIIDNVEGKILIIEDEKDMCESIKSWLDEKGFVCSFAYDGGEALSSIEKEKPDIIILDLMIPGIDGFEVCHRIKHDERFKEIPIIILTVLGETINRVAGFKAGADDYLTKPFDPDELILRIEANLKTRRVSLELKKELDELKEHERIKVEFLGNVGQELLVPIKTIADGISQLGNKNFLSKQKEELEKLSSSLISKLNTFIDVTKANSGKLWIRIDEFPISNVISIVSARIKPDAEKKKLSFDISYPSITMKTEESHLIKILQELLLNAVKFTEKGGIRLEVSEDKENDTVIFNIIDTGHGFGEDEREIFEKEIYVEEKMGLMLVKRLVGILRGNIRLEALPNETKITVILPRKIDAPARRKEDRI